MSQPYVGEVRMVGFNFAPAGWMFCSGQLLPISEYETLFNLIGTTYGGDGQSTFALPDLQGRVPVHQGTNGGSTYTLAETGGVETVTLNINQIPNHSHTVIASADAGDSNDAGNAYLGSGQTAFSASPHILMNAAMDQSVGGSQPHENHQAYLVINFILSLFGVFPSQT
jgi:microcystin-dependent protein